VEQVLLQAFEGSTEAEYSGEALAILSENLHPKFQRPYIELVYAPMIELVALLEARDFQVFVFSGSQQEFVRTVAADRLGIAALYAAGDVVELDYAEGRFVRQDDFLAPNLSGAGKAEAIQYRLGHLPILAAGNSSGDTQMLELAAANPAPNLQLVIRHDDSAREYAYDDERLLARAEAAKWIIVSMANDFATVFR
jgi:phosphoserine phosphatase